jgi:hypothetical protein
MTPEYAAELILAEFKRARTKFKPMQGPHEGYAVILEEMDEMWADIKANMITRSRKEALQVAAMALAYMVEVKGGPGDI